MSLFSTSDWPRVSRRELSWPTKDCVSRQWHFAATDSPQHTVCRTQSPTHSLQYTVCRTQSAVHSLQHTVSPHCNPQAQTGPPARMQLGQLMQLRQPRHFRPLFCVKSFCLFAAAPLAVHWVRVAGANCVRNIPNEWPTCSIICIRIRSYRPPLPLYKTAQCLTLGTRGGRALWASERAVRIGQSFAEKGRKL